MIKICPKCKNEIINPYKNRLECRECLRKRVRKHYERNKDKIIAYKKRYYEINKDKILQYQKNKYFKSPLKSKCRSLVRYSVRYGKLKKRECECCGLKESEGHHKDYSKPLEVVWLCHSCHMKIHHS